MCFGGGSKATPAPQQPTSFQYGPADSSNSQRQVAAMNQDQPSSATYGSDLGSAGTLSGAATPTTQPK